MTEGTVDIHELEKLRFVPILFTVVLIVSQMDCMYLYKNVSQ